MQQLNGNMNTFTNDVGKLYEILLFQCAVELSGRFLTYKCVCFTPAKNEGRLYLIWPQGVWGDNQCPASFLCSWDE